MTEKLKHPAEPTIAPMEIVKEAQKRGMNPSRLTQSQYTMIYADLVRRKEGAKELGKDIKEAAYSRIETDVLQRKISEKRFALNQMVCESHDGKCPSGKHRTLKGNKKACDACGCSGNNLRSKQQNPRFKCPELWWDNTISDEDMVKRIEKLKMLEILPTDFEHGLS